MEDTVACKDRILPDETLRAVWSSPTSSSNQTTGCFSLSLSQHSPAFLYQQPFFCLSLLLSRERPRQPSYILRQCRRYAIERRKKNGTGSFISAVGFFFFFFLRNGRSMSRLLWLVLPLADSWWFLIFRNGKKAACSPGCIVRRLIIDYLWSRIVFHNEEITMSCLIPCHAVSP